MPPVRVVVDPLPVFLVAAACLLAVACGGDDPADVATQNPAVATIEKALATADIDLPGVSIEANGESVQSTRAGVACTSPGGVVQGDGFTDRPEEYLPLVAGGAISIIVEGAGSSVVSALVVDDVESRTLARLNTMPQPSPASFTPFLAPGRYRLAVTSESGECKITDWFGIEISGP